MKNLTEMLATVAQQQGRRTAVVEEHAAVSYLELEQRVLCLAGQLWNQGVRPGNGVAVFLPNGVEFITSFFAIVRLGGIVVPLNDHYRESEITRLLNEATFSFVMTSRRSTELYDHVLQTAARSYRVIHIEDCSWAPGAPIVASPATEVNPDSPVMHQLSSGSTGTPKRISRTHRNLLCELDSLMETLGLNPEERFLGVTPFSHVNGLMRSMMASLRAGATLFPMARFESEAVAGLIEKHRITVFIGVPFMFGVLARSRYRRVQDFSSLRLCLSASPPMRLKLNRQFYDQFGVHVRQLYGSTETGTISVDLSADDSTSLDSVGKPISGVDVTIYTDDGQPQRPDEIGEIAVKSPAAIECYDGDNDLNRASFRNGYFLPETWGGRILTDACI